MSFRGSRAMPTQPEAPQPATEPEAVASAGTGPHSPVPADVDSLAGLSEAVRDLQRNQTALEFAIGLLSAMSHPDLLDALEALREASKANDDAAARRYVETFDRLAEIARMLRDAGAHAR